MVETTQGPLKGVQGYLREKRGEIRLAIMVDGVYQSASFIVDRSLVKKIVESEMENVK